MGFQRLRFFNFRNLKDRELSVGAREVFLVGQNGQGKTNLLEAIHLLCLGSSFREKRDSAFPRDPGLAMGLHGSYGILWVLKSRIFGDRPTSPPSLACRGSSSSASCEHAPAFTVCGALAKTMAAGGPGTTVSTW